MWVEDLELPEKKTKSSNKLKHRRGVTGDASALNTVPNNPMLSKTRRCRRVVSHGEAMGVEAASPTTGWPSVDKE